TEQRPGEGGERWRPGDGQPADGELLVRGPRVLLAEGHRLIAPWSERIRYGARKNGYHGGLTPQDGLHPPSGPASAQRRPPGRARDWWEDTPAATTPPPSPAVKPPRKTPETLWDHAEQEPPPAPEAPPAKEPAAPARPDWVAALLACPLFKEQKRLGGRTVP